jgi:hypothetical protein
MAAIRLTTGSPALDNALKRFSRTTGLHWNQLESINKQDS